MLSFQNGGWGMYPTCALGVLLIGLCLAQLGRLDRRRWPLIAGLAGVVGLVATTGFLAGVIRASENTDGGPLFWVGVGEALNNLVLASALMAVAGVILIIAMWRDGSQHSPRL